jgi:hypothetical protein
MSSSNSAVSEPYQNYLEKMNSAIDAARNAMDQIVLDDVYDDIFGNDLLDERAVA